MENNKFCKQALAILLVFSMLFSLIVVADAENGGEFQIRIVHTNDIHARVQENAKSGIIGMEKLGGIIGSYTAGADMDLVLDSGDLFHGQPIATLVQGESVAQLAKACGYDAMTAGNHDWSYGKDRLKALCASADIAMLSGNVVEDETGNKFFDEEFYTESVTVDGKELKVGIFGVIDPKIKKSTTPSNVAGLTFTDAAEYANNAAAELKAQDCDVVIALSHTYAPDELAAQVSGVDLWLAGHEHLQIDKEVTDADGNTTHVIESGYYLYSLSLIEISGTLDDNGDAENLTIAATPMTYADTSEYESKKSVTTVMNEITAAQAEKLNEKVGSTPVDLDGVWEDLRIYQQNLGNVVTDAYLLETDADVAFENAGGIRASIAAGDVTYGDIIGVSPYGNYVVTKDITGAALKEIMETSLEIQSQCIAANNSGDYDAWPQSSGSYLQFGGMTVTYDPDKEEGSRVLSIKVQGEPLDEKELYTVATNNYVAVSSYYPQLAEAEEKGQFTACDEILVRFFEQSDETIAESVSSERLFRKSTAMEWASGGDGTEESPYLVPDLAALELLRDTVNSGNDCLGMHFKMTADIDMSEKYSESTGTSWSPIGVYVQGSLEKNEITFDGIFDGDGHTIKNLYINAPDADYQALFSCIGTNSTVKNLTVDGKVNAGNATAGITAMTFGTLENCHNAADITGTTSVSGFGSTNGGTLRGCYNTGAVTGEDSVGGVATYLVNGVLSGCYNTGTVTGENSVGGVAALIEDSIAVNCFNKGTVTGTGATNYIGGVIGLLWPGKIENCYNEGLVSGAENVGGVVGYTEGVVKGCYNTGDVSGKDLLTSKRIGGVIGYSFSKVISCRNSGRVSNGSYIGGVVGYNVSDSENCYNTGAVSGYITVGGVLGGNHGGTAKYCYNTGFVSGDDTVSGVAASIYGGAVTENCYNVADIEGRTAVGGVIGYADNGGSLKNCFNIGKLLITASEPIDIGGVAGCYNEEIAYEVINCYYLSGTADGGINGEDVEGAAKSITAEEFADGTVAYLLQSAQPADAYGSVPMVWGQTLTGENADIYPVLTSDSARDVCKVIFTVNDTEYAAAYANPNGTVKLPAAPKKSGYKFVKWSQTNSSDGEEFTADMAVTEDMTVYAITKKSSSGGGGGGSSSKATPAPSATPEPTATPAPSITPEPQTTGAPTETPKPAITKSFADVAENAWYFNSVKYVSDKGLMSGVSETEFAPDMDITRAMFVTVLYRAAGAPDMSDEIWGYPFEDVDAESWYGAAVYWARNNDIVQGYSDEKFAPNEPVTREQMAAILYRYAKLKDYNTEVNGTLNYADNADISEYAKDAVIWNLDNGIMLGNDDNAFAPKANTTRAQAAAVFERITAE